MKVKDTGFAFATAQVRAYETHLLTRAQIDQMIAAKDENEVLDLLASAGWSIDRSENAPEQLSAMLPKTYKMLLELAPDAPEMKLLTVKNDFQNLKAALKALGADTSTEGCYVFPTTLYTAGLKTLLGEKHYDELPKFLQESAQEGYALLMRTMDAQQLDCYLDKMTLMRLMEVGNSCNSSLVRNYAMFLCDAADMKIAYRAAAAKKSKSFLLDALVTTDNLNEEMLATAAARGTDEVISFLSGTIYAQGAQLLAASPAAFEKWCDDEAVSIVSAAKQISFGVEPLFAYYIAKETEITAIRIILVCKESGASIETIAERMRELYV